jgi:hypothetical protein
MVTAALLSTSALMTVGAGELVRNYCRRALRAPVAPLRGLRG